jgi:hypothetical protein
MKSLFSSILTSVVLVLFFMCFAPVAHAQIFTPPCVNPVVVVRSAPVYGYNPAPAYNRTSNVAVSTVGGAAIGALVASRHDAGKGALIGAGAGLLVGLLADRSPTPNYSYNYGYAQEVYSTPVCAYSSPYPGYVSCQPSPVYYTGWIKSGNFGLVGDGYGHEHYGHDRDGGHRRN